MQNKFIATDEKYKYLTCYINTILKTDAFVERVFNLLKKNEIENGRRFSMIYFADHGQVHYHDSNKIILNNNSISALHYEVPLIKIDSYSFDRKINKSRKYGVRFVDGLANWMGIENKIYLRMISLMVLMMNMIMGIKRFWQKRSQLMIQLSI